MAVQLHKAGFSVTAVDPSTDIANAQLMPAFLPKPHRSRRNLPTLSSQWSRLRTNLTPRHILKAACLNACQPARPSSS
ncbi:hypothetical protein [Brevibacterium oceani]|uniref:hypothetical protein n=1 Tax=Brevibacterium oceani TaxID=358099 RepID=UPI003CCE7CA8